MSHVRVVAPPCCPFELSPLNELYRGKLVHSITLIGFETRYFDDIWCTYISGQDDVWRAKMVAPPCYPFEFSPLNELYLEKLVRSITQKPFEI